jgi:hypothetical protein
MGQINVHSSNRVTAGSRRARHRLGETRINVYESAERPALVAFGGHLFPARISRVERRLNAAGASELSITVKSLSWRFNPEAEKFAAPRRSNRLAG